MEGNGLSQIIEALNIVHQPSSSNAQRLEAQKFLESLKENVEAPVWGWQMASSENKNADIVRHFGLTLLQHAITYNFAKYDDQRRSAIRLWVTELAYQINSNDPHYIKEKVSYLWVAIAKRIWGLTDEDGEYAGSDGWPEMDKALLELWNNNASTREFTLSVFRTLFEDIYLLEDQVAAKRATALSAQCIEIVTSEDDLRSAYDERLDALKKLKSGKEGWLKLWVDALQNPESEIFGIKLLETVKACLYWVFPQAIRSTNILGLLSMFLESESIKIRILATDCLHVLFTRNFGNEDFDAIVGSVFDRQGITALERAYNSIDIDIDDFDEQKYVLLKKLAEMIVGLGEHLNAKSRLSKDAYIEGYLRLVLQTTTHDSLVISGFSLQFWCSVLRVESMTGKEVVENMLPFLLEVAAKRCLRYEDVGEGHISRRFLDIDFDSSPEIQAFLGNYRRFVEDIVRLVVCRMPLPCLVWLRDGMRQYFMSSEGQQAFGSSKLNYEGNSTYYLAYSQFMLLDASLKGVSRWKIWYNGPDKDNVARDIMNVVEQWCEEVVGLNVSDPMLLRKLVQSIVQFAPVLKGTNSKQHMFSVLEKVMTACTTSYPEVGTDDDRELVRELRASCGTELNRLAYMIPFNLMDIYDDLERVIGNLLTNHELNEHEVVSFKSFLLVISQRSRMPSRAQKFATIVDPVLQSWSDPETMKGLLDLEWFMARVGIVKIAEYFRSRGVTADTDLLQTKVDNAGRALKAELKASWSALFPVRPTRIFIQYTIEKVDRSSEDFADLLELWKPRVHPILPHILQLTAQIEAYHNPVNWKNLPPEVQSFVRYSTQERFWQVGVSTQTRDEFVEDNMMAMNTLRDFADSVGHIIRYTREYCFLALGSITQLGSTLYEVPNMAMTLWNALAGDSAGISSHAWRHMISLVLRSVIKHCPEEHIESFLGEFVPSMLIEIDRVLVEKWTKVMTEGLQLVGGEENESLSEEMMDEHLLRQLTAIVDRLLIDLVGQHGARSERRGHDRLLLDLVVGKKEILGPLLNLCSHIIAFKDVRCSFNCALVLRNLIPHMLLKDPDVDAFLCNGIMKQALELIREPYFQEVHNEFGYIVALIYTSLRSQYSQPLDVLREYLTGTNCTDEDLSEFEIRLVNTKSARQQRGVLLDFLARMQALNQESQDEYRERARVRAEKKISKSNWMSKKSNGGGNLMEEDGLEQSAIANLFGE